MNEYVEHYINALVYPYQQDFNDAFAAREVIGDAPDALQIEDDPVRWLRAWRDISND